MYSHKMTVKERFDHLRAVIQSEHFQRREGTGNEVPFFIADYPPSDTMAMNLMCEQLVTELHQSGIIVLNVNLYDTSINLLKERGIWERTLEIEPTRRKSEILDLLRNVLDPESHLVPAIQRQMAEKGHFDVLFLSGVGEVYPYIRSHTVLTNLQLVVTGHPVVIFFPGRYEQTSQSGSVLNLFNRFQGDKYYRAFNIFQYEI
jgi:hypothetical protein